MIKKKSLGQNFLRSESALFAMVEAGKVIAKDSVIEIGPGEGALTKKLLETGCNVLAFEKDHRLMPLLEQKFTKEIKTGKFKLLEKDILELDMSKDIFDMGTYKVVANIPYYITGQIIRMFLEAKKQPESMTILVQKEVAERIIARDGKESLLSLSVKVFGEPKYIKKVPAGSFSPPPKVDSAILCIENISRKKLGFLDEKLFFKVLHAGFAHKRKQLLPNLTSLYKKDDLIETFNICKIDMKARAEDLSLGIWLKLCTVLK